MKKDDKSIDENELMKMMAHPFSKDRELPEKEKPNDKETKEKTSSKTKQVKKTSAISKKDEIAYKELFLQKNQIVARNGKAIYIRPELHERLFRIARVIGGNNISVSNYLDNILQYHFTEFEAEIRKLFKDNFKPII